MMEFFYRIFGAYTPVTYEVPLIEHLAEGEQQVYYNVIPDGLAGVDWQYILAWAAFIVVLYSVLRIIEAVIRSV